MSSKKSPATARQINASTNAFLKALSGGRLTFGQLLSSIREADEQSLAQFAARLDISRQHLHQLESGAKRVSPERAVRFAQVLGYNELYFVQLALQDLVDEIGIDAKVEVNVA
jgi:transcriptional regulator with XRE-family HTH domain